MKNTQLGVAIIGAGMVSNLQYFPAIQLDPRARLVAICDASPDLLVQRKADWGVSKVYDDYHQLLSDPEVDAVVIATPNFTHVDIGLAAISSGKHVLCEKPLGVNSGDVERLYDSAQQSGLVHMTAFTYRFPPAMKYIKHLVATGDLGSPRHFRSQRFLDLPETSWGWRQYQDKAGAGDLFDMTIHRIDFAIDLLGPLKRLTGSVARFADRTTTSDGRTCPPSNVDDWSALIGEFECGATGVWEGTTLAKGYHVRGFNFEWAEVNGSEGSAVYRLDKPNQILLGRSGGDLEETPVPTEYLKPADSPRSTTDPDPALAFRYDIMWEFISAITENRQAVPSFAHGLYAQRIAEAVLESSSQGKWIDVSNEKVM